MSLQLVQANCIGMTLRLHPKPQSDTKNTHRVRVHIIHADKPRILLDHVQVFARKVHFDVVAAAAMAAEHADGLQLNQGGLQRGVKRSAWSFIEQLCEASAVDCEHPGVNVVIQQVPADTEEGLIGNQPDSTLARLDGMIRVQFEHSGDDAPQIGIDLVRGFGQNTAWMFELMTIGAKGDTFELIMFVIVDNVIEDFFCVAVETPQAENDMIEVNKMMTL